MCYRCTSKQVASVGFIIVAFQSQDESTTTVLLLLSAVCPFQVEDLEALRIELESKVVQLEQSQNALRDQLCHQEAEAAAKVSKLYAHRLDLLLRMRLEVTILCCGIDTTDVFNSCTETCTLLFRNTN